LPELLTDNAAGLHVLVDDLTLAERLIEAFGPRLWLEIVRPVPATAPGLSTPSAERDLLEGGRRLGLRRLPAAPPTLPLLKIIPHSAWRRRRCGRGIDRSIARVPVHHS